MESRILFIFFFSLPLTGQCQILNVPGAGNEILREKGYQEIQGSPYLFEDWKSGSITSNIGTVYTGLKIKYDAYKDVVEILQNGAIMEINPKLYNDFRIQEEGHKEYFFKNDFKPMERFNQQSYFEVLFQGKIYVLRKIKVDYISENVTNFGSSNEIKKFIKNESYFFVQESGGGIEFKLNKKSVMNLFPDKNEEIEGYIAREKIKCKTIEEIVRIASFYESIK